MRNAQSVIDAIVARHPKVFDMLYFHDRPEFERIHHITYFFVTIFFVIHKCLNLNAETTPIVSLCVHNDNLFPIQ